MRSTDIENILQHSKDLNEGILSIMALAEVENHVLESENAEVKTVIERLLAENDAANAVLDEDEKLLRTAQEVVLSLTESLYHASGEVEKLKKKCDALEKQVEDASRGEVIEVTPTEGVIISLQDVEYYGGKIIVVPKAQTEGKSLDEKVKACGEV